MPYDNLEKRLGRLPQSTEEGSDFKLVDVSGEPLHQVVTFLESRPKLGPAGRDLLAAIGGYLPLTEAQETLLLKVLAKMGHPEWLEPVMEEHEITVQALEAVDEECSHSALNMV